MAIEDPARDIYLDCLALLGRRTEGLVVLEYNVVRIEFDLDRQTVALRDSPAVYPEGEGATPLEFPVEEFESIASYLAEPWTAEEVEALVDSGSSDTSTPSIALPAASSTTAPIEE